MINKKISKKFYVCNMVELNYIQTYHIHFDMKSWRNEERKECRNNERKLNVIDGLMKEMQE
jgi:hypothetical protein